MLNAKLNDILLITKCFLSFSMRFVAKLQISKIVGTYQSPNRVENVAGINRPLMMHPQKRNQLGIKKPRPLSLVGMKHPVMPRVARLQVLLPQLECGMPRPVILLVIPLQVCILKSKFIFMLSLATPGKRSRWGETPRWERTPRADGSETPGWGETPRADRGITETPTPHGGKRRSRWDETPASQHQGGVTTPQLGTPTMGATPNFSGVTPAGALAMGLQTPSVCK